MKLDGKKVIALGERDGVPGPAIAGPGTPSRSPSAITFLPLSFM